MLASDLESVSLVECRPEVAVEAFNAAYSGYIVPLVMTLRRFEARFRAEDVDPFASRVWFMEARPAALMLVSRRGRDSRLSAFGVAAQFRGRGVGRSVCEQAVFEARARGDARMCLEVFESNALARALYSRVGFKEGTRLFGFTLSEASRLGAAEQADEVSIKRGVEIGGRHLPLGDTPWMLEPATLAACTAPVRCFADRCGEFVAFIEELPSEMRMIALLGSLDAGRAAAFMAGLRVQFRHSSWTAPPIYPENFAGQFFEPAGWSPSGLSQVRMFYDL